MSKILNHHKEQFGDVPVILKALKLCEEVGELTEAYAKFFDKRIPNSVVNKELSDVLIVVIILMETEELDYSEVNPNIPESVKVSKLVEDAGKVAGAYVRLHEERDGEDWRLHVHHSLLNIFATLRILIYFQGYEFDDFCKSAFDNFLSRQWKVTKS